MAQHKPEFPLDITLDDFQTGIRNEEDSGFVLSGITISKDRLVNLAIVNGGAPPQTSITLKKLTSAASDPESADVEANKLNQDLGSAANLLAYGLVSLEGLLCWVAATRETAATPPDAIIPQTGGDVPALPDYAAGVLTAAAGIPWARAVALPAADGYDAVRPGGVRVFTGLAGMPNNVTRAVYYESKFAIDNDGRGGNAAGDPSHQSQTSLKDADGDDLNALTDHYAVLPMDTAEALVAHDNNNKIEEKKDGLPDFSRQLGLQLGDLGVAFWRAGANGEVKRAFFIYGDKGPANKLGEGSCALAQSLGLDPDPNNGGLNRNDVMPGGKFTKGVAHFGFPGSGAAFLSARNKSRLIPTQIEAAAKALFDAFLRQPVPAAAAHVALTGTNPAIYAFALKNSGKLDTHNVPETNGGQLACAWAVNEVVRQAIGHQVGGGLSTADMFAALQKQDTGQEVNQAGATAGSIIISPTETIAGKEVHGHVGILGEGQGDDRRIYSNSSKEGVFRQNYTLGKWNERYLGLKLKVHFFNVVSKPTG